MTSLAPESTPIRQWWVLTARGLGSALRGGSMLTALIAPIVFTLGFYVPLHAVITRFSGGIAQHAIAPRDPQASAVAAHVLVLVVDVLLGPRQQLVDHLSQVAATCVGGRDDGADDGAAEQLVERVREQFETEIVEKQDAALQIPPQDDRIGVLDQLAKAELVGVGQLFPPQRSRAHLLT